MGKLSEEEIIHLNKIKWDSWADNNTLENRRVRFLFFKFCLDFAKYQKYLVDLIDFSRVNTFLDIGCGTGWAVRYASEKAGENGTFYGIDLSQNMIDKAKANYKDFNNLNFITADATRLPFESDFLDIIISTYAFHHFPDPHKALNEIHRVMKSPGKLFILDITTDGPFAKFINYIGKKHEKEHIDMYSTSDYKKMFAKAGLDYLQSFKTGKLKPIKIHIGEKR